MAIKLECPRCKRPLSVPNRKIGRYAACPRCGGRFWVPEDAGGRSAGAEVASPSPEPAAGGGPSESADRPPATVSIGGSATVAPQRGPEQAAGGQRTARFVAAQPGQSPIQAAEDGKLPELHLKQRQNGRENKVELKTTSVNPLVLLGLLTISVALSVGLVLVDFGPRQDGKKDQARRKIEEYYFPRAGQQPLEYQACLMEAQRAATRGDRQAERRAYERVLDLLRQERPLGVKADDREWSLTGDDRRLKELIAVLLSGD